MEINIEINQSASLCLPYNGLVILLYCFLWLKKNPDSRLQQSFHHISWHPSADGVWQVFIESSQLLFIDSAGTRVHLTCPTLFNVSSLPPDHKSHFHVNHHITFCSGLYQHQFTRVRIFSFNYVKGEEGDGVVVVVVGGWVTLGYI